MLMATMNLFLTLMMKLNFEVRKIYISDFKPLKFLVFLPDIFSNEFLETIFIISEEKFEGRVSFEWINVKRSDLKKKNV